MTDLLNKRLREGVELFESGGEASQGCLRHGNYVRSCSPEQWGVISQCVGEMVIYAHEPQHAAKIHRSVTTYSVSNLYLRHTVRLSRNVRPVPKLLPKLLEDPGQSTAKQIWNP